MSYQNNFSKLLRNLSVPLISDVLDSIGVNGGLSNIMPLNTDYNIAGPVYTVLYEKVSEGQEAPAGDYIEEVEEGSVILIDNQGNHNCTVWGDILSYVAKSKKIEGTVINGSCRDIKKILELKYPVFCKNRYMKSGKNRVKLKSTQERITINGQDIFSGDYIRGDASGVIVIPSIHIEYVIQTSKKLEKVEKLILEDLNNSYSLKDARKKHGYNNYSYLK